MMLVQKIKGHGFRLAGFSVVGLISTVVSLGLIAIGNEVLCWNSTLSYLMSCLLSIGFSYVMNTVWIWKAKFSILNMLRYYLIYSVSILIGAVLLNVLEYLLPAVNSTILSFSIVPITMVWNYYFVNKILSENHG